MSITFLSPIKIGSIKPSSTACLVDTIDKVFPALTITTLTGPLAFANFNKLSGQIISFFESILLSMETF